MTKEKNKRRRKGLRALLSMILSLLLFLQGFIGMTVYAGPSPVQANFSGELKIDNTFLKPEISTGDTTRQISDFTGVVVADTCNYFTRNLTPDTTGNYTIEVTSANLGPTYEGSAGYGTPQAPIPAKDDTILFLYNSFDPASPMTGLLYANDDIASFTHDTALQWYDNGNNFKSRLTNIPLIAGQTYVLVATTYMFGVTGTINFTVSGPGNMSVTGNDYSSDMMTISGNAGIGGAVLSYDDGGAKTVTADSNGAYSIYVSSGWSGTVTPSKSGYTFAPVSKSYKSITTNQTSQNYTANSSLSNDATLKASSMVKGQTVTGLGTPNAALASAVAGTVSISAAQAADTNNAAPYITLFDPTDSNVTSVKVVKYASGSTATETNFESAAEYGNGAISNGDFFIVKVVAEDGSTTLYYKVNVILTPAASTGSIEGTTVLLEYNGQDYGPAAVGDGIEFGQGGAATGVAGLTIDIDPVLSRIIISLSGSITIAEGDDIHLLFTGGTLDTITSAEMNYGLSDVKYPNAIAISPGYGGNTISIGVNQDGVISDGDILVIDFTATSTVSLSSDAGLTSVAGETIAAGSEAGTLGAPKTASVNVANAKAALGLSDIVAATDATVKLYSNAEFSQEITGTSTIALTAGGATTAYIMVTA